MYRVRSGIHKYLDVLVKELPNLDVKLIQFWMYTINTYAYFETIVAAIFIDIISSSLKFDHDT